MASRSAAADPSVRRAKAGTRVLLDVRFLVELLSSSAWTWTREACERLLGQLGLSEAEGVEGRRDFRAPTGLMASLYSRPDGSPSRIEFPFEVPLPVRATPEHVAQFVELTAWPLRAVLGEPTAASDTPGGVRCWSIPRATLTVSEAGEEVVSLIVARPS
jgi:hypothetical protein